MDWHIREAGSDDFDALAGLMFELQSYESRLHKGPKVSLESARKRLRSLMSKIQRQGGEIWLGFAPDGSLAGFLVGILSQENPADLNPDTSAARRDIGLISDLCVTEAYRGQGLAKRLVSEAELFFESQDCQAVSVANLCANMPAAQLYESLGYGVVFQWREKQL